MNCPDDARCYHGCKTTCWRVRTCLPLSAYGDQWAPEIVAAHATPDERVRIEDVLIARRTT